MQLRFAGLERGLHAHECSADIEGLKPTTRTLGGGELCHRVRTRPARPNPGLPRRTTPRPVWGKTRAMGSPVFRTSHQLTSSPSSSRSSTPLLQLRYLGPGFLSLLHLSLPQGKPTAPGPLRIMSGGGNIKVVVRYVITTNLLNLSPLVQLPLTVPDVVRSTREVRSWAAISFIVPRS